MTVVTDANRDKVKICIDRGGTFCVSPLPLASGDGTNLSPLGCHCSQQGQG